MVRLFAILLLLLMIACGGTSAPPTTTPAPPPPLDLATLPPIRVRVYPRMALPPIERVTIEILIVVHPDNRKFCMEVDGPGLFSESCQDLPGANAAFLYSRGVLGLMVPGEYLVKAKLYRAPRQGQVYATATAVVHAGTASEALWRP